MGMVGDQRPGETFSVGFIQQGLQPVYEVLSILIITKDRTAGDAAYDNMMQQIRTVDAGLSWHAGDCSREPMLKQ